MACQASKRLHETLEEWKDHWRICELAITIKCRGDKKAKARLLSGIPPWRDYERIVLNNAVKDIDSVRFAGAESAYDVLPALRRYIGFPTELFYWNRESRRVYVLEKALQHEFVQGTYPDLKWTDLKWPLDFFLLSLEEPLIAEDRFGVWVKYDTIFASRIYDGHSEHISMRIMREPLKEVNREAYRAQLATAEKYAERGDYDKAFDFFKRGTKNRDKEIKSRQGWRSIPLYSSLLGYRSEPRIRINPEDFIGTIRAGNQLYDLEVSDVDEEEHAERISMFAKLVVGSCLYINAMSSPPKERPRKVPLGVRGVTGIITDAAHICDVVGKGVMDPTVYGIQEPRVRASVLFVRPHSRRGFWRRPAGSLPNAPKTVWVPHTIVRKDLIPDFGLMGGTETKIKSDE